MTSFTVSSGAVIWNGPAPFALSETSVEALLDIFDREGAVQPFNELYDAYVRVGGIERCCSLKGTNAQLAATLAKPRSQGEII